MTARERRLESRRCRSARRPPSATGVLAALSSAASVAVRRARSRAPLDHAGTPTHSTGDLRGSATRRILRRRAGIVTAARRSDPKLRAARARSAFRHAHWTRCDTQCVRNAPRLHPNSVAIRAPDKICARRASAPVPCHRPQAICGRLHVAGEHLARTYGGDQLIASDKAPLRVEAPRAVRTTWPSLCTCCGRGHRARGARARERRALLRQLVGALQRPPGAARRHWRAVFCGGHDGRRSRVPGRPLAPVHQGVSRAGGHADAAAQRLVRARVAVADPRAQAVHPVPAVAGAPPPRERGAPAATAPSRRGSTRCAPIFGASRARATATAHEVCEESETVLVPSGWFHHAVSLSPSITLAQSTRRTVEAFQRLYAAPRAAAPPRAPPEPAPVPQARLNAGAGGGGESKPPVAAAPPAVRARPSSPPGSVPFARRRAARGSGGGRRASEIIPSCRRWSARVVCEEEPPSL